MDTCICIAGILQLTYCAISVCISTADSHIGRITCFFHLRRLHRLSHTIDPDVLLRLVSVLVLSMIDYCNVVFAGLPATTLAPLRRVMNAAIRFVARLRPRESWPRQQCSAWSSLAADWTAYRLQTLCHDACFLHQHHARVHLWPCHTIISPWMESPSMIGCSGSLWRTSTLDEDTHWLKGLFFCGS